MSPSDDYDQWQRPSADADQTSVDFLFDKLNSIDERLDQIMSTLADLVAEDSALNDEVNQVIQLVKDDTALIASLKGAIGSGNLTPEQQAQVDGLFAQMTAQHDAIVAALTPPPVAPAPPADVPPAPPADVPPTPAP